jgi:hypothetical protein
MIKKRCSTLNLHLFSMLCQYCVACKCKKVCCNSLFCFCFCFCFLFFVFCFLFFVFCFLFFVFCFLFLFGFLFAIGALLSS